MKRLPWNWRQRIETTVSKQHYEEIARGLGCSDEVHFELDFISGRTPKGFTRQIGFLCVDQNDPYHVVDAWIHSYFRNRGLGICLYEQALHYFGKLTTCYHSSSQDARALWKSLIQKYCYKTDFFDGKLTIFITVESREHRKMDAFETQTPFEPEQINAFTMETPKNERVDKQATQKQA